MNLRKFLNQPLTQLDKVQHRLILIGFIVVFSIFFLNVFVPFNINRWSKDSGIEQWIRLSGFGLIGGIVLAISQLVIRKISGMNRFRVWTFLLWFSGELVLMAFLFVIYQSHREFDWMKTIEEVPESIKLTLLSVLIPYSLALLFISLLIQKSKLNEQKIQNHTRIFESNLFDFPDEKGIVRFSIAINQVLYLESADNYLIVVYLNGEKPVRQMLRNSLKNFESLLAGSTMKRCHRSFMVNLQKIEFVDYEKAACRIKLSGWPDLIPVSRKFYPEFKSYLSVSE